MKIKFNSDENSPLSKITEIPIMTIILRGVFHENNKYYPQVLEEHETWIKGKIELKGSSIKLSVSYYFDDIING